MSHKLRVFLSSPGDVGLERDLAVKVIDRLQGEFSGQLEVETIRWEDRPVQATESFQPQIVPPSQTDIVVCILWSRLGTPLSEEYVREDGTRYGSGTEWEFEDAVRAYRVTGAPDLLVYRRTQEPMASLKDSAQWEARRAQYQALEAFVQKWFFSEDGTFKAAFKIYEAPDAFERTLENDLRRLFEEHLPDHLSAPDERAEIRWRKGSPYRGLAAFDAEHAAVFFGRTRAVADVKDALIAQAAKGAAFVLMFGMSGGGKSSVLRAGVVATLTRPGVVDGVDQWRSCAVRPSSFAGSLCQGLAAELISAVPELADGGIEPAEFAALLTDAPQHAIAPLKMALARLAQSHDSGAAVVRLLLAVDQLEEMFTLKQFDAIQREQFVAAIAALSRSGLVWVVGTMRSDFYPLCAQLPELAALKDGAGQYDLLPPTFDEIGQMIAYPTRAAGLRFELDAESGERLDALLHEAAAGNPRSLPLLSFTLDELYQRRSDQGVLTLAAYRELGGIEGALAQRAEATFASLPVDVQDELPSLLRSLVARLGEEDEQPTSRPVVLADVDVETPRGRLIAALIEARLLATDRADDGQPVARLAHEALLEHWPRVRQWLEEDREFLRIRDRVSRAADVWRKEQEPEDMLLAPGRALQQAEDLLTTRARDLTSDEVRYVRTSQRVAAGRRRRRLAVALGSAAIFFAVVSAFGAFSYVMWGRAEGATVAAVASEKQANEAAGRAIEAESKAKRERDEAIKQRDRGDTLQEIAYEFLWDFTIKFGDVVKANPSFRAIYLNLIREHIDKLDTIIAIAPDALRARRQKASMLGLAAEAFSRAGQMDDAVEYAEQAIALVKAIEPFDTEKAHRDAAAALAGAAQGLANANRADEALVASSHAMDILAGVGPDAELSTRRLHHLFLRLHAQILGRMGRTQESLTALEQTLAMHREVHTIEEATRKSRLEASSILLQIGDALAKLGRDREAIERYHESVKLRVDLFREDDGIEIRARVADAFEKEALALHGIGDVARARTAFLNLTRARKGLIILKDSLIPKDGYETYDRWKNMRNASTACRLAGDMEIEIGDRKQGEALYGEAVEIGREMVARRPTMENALHLSSTYVSIGNALRERDIIKAEGFYRNAAALWRALVKRSPDNAAVHGELAFAVEKVARVAQDLEDFAEAIYRREDLQEVRAGVLADFEQFRRLGVNPPGQAQIELELGPLEGRPPEPKEDE
jgi:tetratricopeptide (TPR) repeat protein